jgi:hypothetical protein
VAAAEYKLGIGWAGLKPARMSSGVFPGAVVYDEVPGVAGEVQASWEYSPTIHELGAYVQCFQGKILQECTDAPPFTNWRDPTTNRNCSEYADRGWCRGRVASVLGPKCVDLAGWVSRGGATCADYAARGYCAHGGYGEGWLPEYGSFADWPDAKGVDASKACCVCGAQALVEPPVPPPSAASLFPVDPKQADILKCPHSALKCPCAGTKVATLWLLCGTQTLLLYKVTIY